MRPVIRRAFEASNIAIGSGILACACIAAFTLWHSSAGYFPHFPRSDNAYLDLGESFLHGQLSLLEKPSPQLIAVENPYDPAQRTPQYYWDASYYKGQYYLYWGPAPALAFAAIEGVTHTRPPGSLLVVICYIGLPIIFFIVLYRIWKNFFPSTPGFSIGLCILAGFINLPFLFLLGRPIIYETSIIVGQFFLFLGLLSWMMYAFGEDKSGWLILTGLSWGLSIGSRYNLVFSVIVYLAFALIQIARAAKDRQQWIKFIYLLAPLAFCFIALGVYNFARLGDPFETGLTYQLSIPEARSEKFYSTSYLLSNLFIYLFYPMVTSSSFPFVLTNLPIGSQFDEVVAGLLPSVPVTWLAALVIPSFILKRISTGARQDISDQERLKSFSAMMVIAASAQFLFLLVFFFDAMRYMADFYLPLMLGIWMLVWRTDELLQPMKWLRMIFWIAVTVLTFWTAAIGVFGSFGLPSQVFHNSNPVLYVHLESYWNERYAEIISLFKTIGIFGSS